MLKNRASTLLHLSFRVPLAERAGELTRNSCRLPLAEPVQVDPNIKLSQSTIGLTLTRVHRAEIWGGTFGRLWLDDWVLQEIGRLNVLRRTGTPIDVRVVWCILGPGSDVASGRPAASEANKRGTIG